MSKYNAGSVSAKIEIDTKDAEKAIEHMKEEIKSVKGDFKNVVDGLVTDNRKLTKQVKNLREENEQLTKSANDVRKGFDFSRRSIENYRVGLKKAGKGISDLDSANQKLNKNLSKTITLNKKVNSSLKDIDPSKFNKFTKELYDYLDATADAEIGLGKKTISLNKLKKEFADVSKDAKEFESALSHALHTINAPIKGIKKGNVFFDITNLKKPILETTKSTNSLVSTAQKANKSLAKFHQNNIDNARKETELVTKYTLDEIAIMKKLNKEFLFFKKDRYLPEGRSRDLYPLDSKHEHVSYTKYLRKFQRSYGIDFTPSLLGVDSISNFPEQFQTRMKQLLKDLNVTLSDEMQGLYKRVRDKESGQLFEFLDLSKFEDASVWLNEIEDKLRGFRSYAEQIRDLSNKMYGLELYPTSFSEQFNPSVINNASNAVKILTGNIKELTTAQERLTTPVRYSFQELYSYLDKLPQQAQMAIRNIGWAIQKKQLGTYGKKPRKKMLEDIKKEFVNLPMLDVDKLLEDVSTQTSRNISRIANISREIERFGGVEEKTTTKTKELGEAIKYTATQINILKDIMEWVNRLGNDKNHPINEGYINSGLYLELENKYVRDLTNMSMDSVIAPHKLRSRFQREIKPLFDDLKIGFDVATQKMGYPVMDFTNMISENEFKRLIGEVKELGTVEEETTDKTRQLVEETKAWTMALANVLKTQLLTPLNTYTQKSNKIIEDMTHMAEANEYFAGTAQRVNHALKQIAKLKEGKYGFGFMGDDAYDTRYMRNTIRALGERSIVPKNKENRKYSGWDKEFLRNFFKWIYSKPIGDTISASDLKIPSEKNLNNRLGTSFAYQEKYLMEYEDNYKQFVKDIQTHIIGLLREFNIELSTELSNSGKRIRVWIEELGKYQNIGSLDLSNMIRFDSIEELEMFLDRATKNTKELEEQLIKTTVANEKFNESFAKTAGTLIRKEFQENPLIGTYKGGEKKGKNYYYIDGMNIIKQLREIYGLAEMTDHQIDDLIYDSQILMDLTGKLQISAVVKGLDTRNPKLISSTIKALDTSLVNKELAKSVDEVKELGEAEKTVETESKKVSEGIKQIGTSADKSTKEVDNLNKSLKETQIFLNNKKNKKEDLLTRRQAYREKANLFQSTRANLPKNIVTAISSANNLKKLTDDVIKLSDSEEKAVTTLGDFVSEEIKAEINSKKLSSAMLDLSGNTKYSLADLNKNVSQLPTKYKGILDILNDINSSFAKGDFEPITPIKFFIDALKEGKLDWRLTPHSLLEEIGNTTDFNKIFDFESLFKYSDKAKNSIDNLTKSIIELADQLISGAINFKEYHEGLMKLTGIPYQNLALTKIGGDLSHYMDLYPIKSNFTRQKNKQKYIDIPFKTWEEIQKLPVNYKNWLAYGKLGWNDGTNQSSLDLDKNLYTYKELMEEFWRLPRHYQKIILDVQDQIKDIYGGKIPKDLSKSKIRQMNLGSGNKETREFVNWYKKQFPDRNRPSFHPRKPIKDIPIDYYGTTVSPKEIQQFYEEWDKWQSKSKEVKSSTEEVVVEVKKLGEAEETTAKSTDVLTNSVKKNAEEHRKRMGQIRKYYGKTFPVTLSNVASKDIQRVQPNTEEELKQLKKSLDKSGSVKYTLTELNELIQVLPFQLAEAVGRMNDMLRYGGSKIDSRIEDFVGNLKKGILEDLRKGDIVKVPFRYTDMIDFDSIDKEFERVRQYSEGVISFDEFIIETKKVNDSLKDMNQSVLDVGTSEEKLNKETEGTIKFFEDVSSTSSKVHNILGKGRHYLDNYRVGFKTIKSDVEGAQKCLDSFVGEVPKSVTTLEQFSTASSKASEIVGKGRGKLDNYRIGFKKVKEEVEQLVMAVERTGTQHSFRQFTLPFDDFVKTIKQVSPGLAQLFNQVKLIPTVTSSAKLPKNVVKFVDTLKNKLEGVTKEVKLLTTSTSNWKDSLSFGQLNPNHISNYSEQLNRLGRSAEKVQTDFKRLKKEMNITFDGKSRKENIFQQLNRMDAEDSVLYKINSRYLQAYGLTGQNGAITQSEQPIANTTRALKTFDATVVQVARDIKEQLIASIQQLIIANKDNENFAPPVHQWKQALNEIDAFIRRYEVLQQRMYELSRGMGKWSNQGKQNTGYGKVLQDQWLAKQMGASVVGDYSLLQPIEDLLGSKGRVNVEGYSDYVARMSEIVAKLKEASISTNEYKEQLKLLAENIKSTGQDLNRFATESDNAIMALTKMAEANERFSRTSKLGKDINKITENINHFASVSDKHNQSLAKFGEQANILKDRFNVLNEEYRKGTLSAEQYDAEIKKLTESLRVLESSSIKTIRETNLIDPKKAEESNKHIKQSTQSLREFGTQMGKNEQYVNNLYRGLQKARSVIISIKTIGRMMGGMALWNFAFDLVESAKETYIAKNEMESLLNKNTKVNASGVQTFNKALDETVDRFQKINKYSLGETGASIGLEFNLTAQEMGKSLPIIAMIQSEYIRAGRTVEEASLAVKDILQGEFMRLSRETGIGKTDLQEKYGWNGDNTDVLNLMKALEKAGKERHWDTFAEKATSLNDVLTITKSRFSELGAEIGTTAEPLLVGAFNTMLGAVDGLKQGFEGLGSFGKNFTLFLGSVSGIVGLSSAYLTLAKGFGALDIATLGWTRSMASSVLQLNKSEVAMHGLLRTLIATSSGTKANTIAQIGLKKAIAGRILGLDQLTIAERGFGTASVRAVSKLKEEKEIIEVGNSLKGKSINLEKASLLTKDKANSITGKLVATELTRSQRLAYLTTNLKYNEVAELSRGKAILKTATSWRVLRTAMMGVLGIGIATWFASVASWTDHVKKNIEGFNNVVDNGDSLVKSAKSDWENATKAIEDQNARIDKYNAKHKDTTQLLREKRALIEDETTAEKNYYNTVMANNRAKVKAEKLDKRQSKINTNITTAKAKALMAVGNTQEEASLMATNAYSEVNVGYYYQKKALDEYKRISLELIDIGTQHGLQLQAQGVDQEKINQFMDEYLLKAEEASQHLKQFNEGDIWAGAYYALDRLTLEWIKFTNSAEGDKFFKSLKEFYKWLEPSLINILNSLKGIAKWAIDTLAWFTSSDLGKTALTWAGLGTVIGIAGLKLGKWASGAKSSIEVAKKLGGKLKDLAKGWRSVGKNAEDADEKTPKTTPEGTVPPTNSKYRYKDLGEWGADVKQDFLGNARNFLKYATQIAMAMTLVTEAILLLELPMWGLAKVGEHFKVMEPNIKKGIEGLKVIAPVMATFLPPTIALMYIMQTYGDKIDMKKVSKKSFAGIAVAIGLITEAILLLNLPLLSLGLLGYVATQLGDNVKKGVEAMKIVAESLLYLAPFIPVFILGVLIVEEAFVNAPLAVAEILSVVGGIALGMSFVAIAIESLRLPLLAIADIGNNYTDLSNVRQGADALKLTAEAMGYVADALGAFARITWSALSDAIARLIGVKLNINLTDLTGEGGFFDQLNTFIKEFNSDDLKIETPDAGKVEAIKSAGTGISAIGDAMKSIDTALHNLPREFTGEGETLNDKYAQAVGNAKQSTYSDDPSNYFDQFKEPIKQLKEFIDDFNSSDEFKIELGEDWQERVNAISQSADMISQVNEAVQKVKTTMQGIGDSGHATAFAEGGALMAFGYDLFHMSGEGSINNGASSGEYKSSLGSQLKEMEDVIADMFTFQSNISQYSGGGGEGTDVSGLTNLITVVQTAISNLSQSLSDAVPNMEAHGGSLSNAIVKGFNDNLKFGDVPAKIANQIMNSKDTLYNTATSLGKTTATKFKEGVDKMSEYMTWEISHTNTAISERKEELGQTAYDLASYVSSRFKDGLDMNSPGLMARATEEEVGYIGQALTTNNLPQMAFDLANALTSNFNLDFNLGNFQLPDMSQWTEKLSVIIPTVSGIKTQVSTNFNAMKTNVQNSFNGIVSKTQTSMSSMKTATIGHIGGIKSSWRGMQDALIASAEHIRSQTASKIDKLKTNMGDFWNKIKHPDQLVGGSAGGKPRGTIPQRKPFRGFAGAPIFKRKISRKDPSDYEEEGLKCQLQTGKLCYSGGWDFDWTPKISGKFKGWNTHFNKFKLDNHLNVGKFENSNFPVKGQVDIFRDYISEVIGATTYDYYYDGRYSPAEALRRGSFNCYDGTRVILALANAFGLTGGGMGHGTWGKDGHVWATIPGIGIIDPTAIQRGYGFKSPKVKGYGAGSPTVNRNSSKQDNSNSNTTTNHNEVHIHIEGDVYGIDDLNEKIEEGANRVARRLFRNSYSGV